MLVYRLLFLDSQKKGVRSKKDTHIYIYIDRLMVSILMYCCIAIVTDQPLTPRLPVLPSLRKSWKLKRGFKQLLYLWAP